MVFGSCNVILFCCFSSTCVPGPGVQQPKPQRAGPLVPRYLRLVLDIWTWKIEESIFGKIEIYSAVLQHSTLKQWNMHLFKYYHRAYKILSKITKLAMSFLVQKPCSISFFRTFEEWEIHFLHEMVYGLHSLFKHSANIHNSLNEEGRDGD